MKQTDMESLACLSGFSHLQILGIYDSTCRDHTGLEELKELTTIFATEEQKKALEKQYPEKRWNISLGNKKMRTGCRLSQSIRIFIWS